MSTTGRSQQAGAGQRRPSAWPWPAAAGVALLSVVLLAGCYRAQFPQQGDHNQIAWGQAVYRTQCARCHDPDRVAPILTEERLVRYENAKNLYEYVRNNMPLDKPGQLPEADYWDVTAYILADDKILTVPNGAPLQPANAESASFAAR